MSGFYDDMLSLVYHGTKTKPHMPMSDRAAQFSPFAALTGYEAAIDETARFTEEKITLGEDAKAELEQNLQYLYQHSLEHPEVVMTCFQKDERKAGGSYVTICGAVKKIDGSQHCILLETGVKIAFEDLLTIQLTEVPTKREHSDTV